MTARPHPPRSPLGGVDPRVVCRACVCFSDRLFIADTSTRGTAPANCVAPMARVRDVVAAAVAAAADLSAVRRGAQRCKVVFACARLMLPLLPSRSEADKGARADVVHSSPVSFGASLQARIVRRVFAAPPSCTRSGRPWRLCLAAHAPADGRRTRAAARVRRHLWESELPVPRPVRCVDALE